MDKYILRESKIKNSETDEVHLHVSDDSESFESRDTKLNNNCSPIDNPKTSKAA